MQKNLLLLKFSKPWLRFLGPLKAHFSWHRFGSSMEMIQVICPRQDSSVEIWQQRFSLPRPAVLYGSKYSTVVPIVFQGKSSSYGTVKPTHIVTSTFSLSSMITPKISYSHVLFCTEYNLFWIKLFFSFLNSHVNKYKDKEICNM